MPSTLITEVINEGPSQVIRIPAEFRLDAETVAIRRNEETGELVVSAKPIKRGDWKAFFEFVDTLDVPQDYMAERPLNRLPVDATSSAMSSTRPLLFLLDADTSSYFIRGRHPKLRAKVLSTPHAEFAISATTRAELLYGLVHRPFKRDLQRSRFSRRHQDARMDARSGRTIRVHLHQLISAGQPIGELDMFLAAHSIARGATLFTNNLRHFQRIDLPLRLENWAEQDT